MRTLTSTLQTAQESKSIRNLIKVEFTYSATTYTYTKSRFIKAKHKEQPFSQKATIVLHNRDKTLTDIDLTGFKAVISWGAIGKDGEEYSATAPLYVKTQRYDSYGYANAAGDLLCQLELIGIPNLLAYDKANSTYQPEEGESGTLTGTVTFTEGSATVTGSGTDFTGELEDYNEDMGISWFIRPSGGTKWYLVQTVDSNTQLTLSQVVQSGDGGTDDANSTPYYEGMGLTIKELIDDVLGASLDCFSHCTPYDTVWDSEDDIVDTYQPRDSFRIYTGKSRLTVIKELLAVTKVQMRVEADGKFHFFVPTITGETYDAEYSLASGHPFFSEAYQNSLVLPSYFCVMSEDDDDPQYSGYASVDQKLTRREYIRTTLESDAQATAIAEAYLANAQLWSQAGAANVPINCGQEVFDYIKVTDQRQGNYRVGNIGVITREYNHSKDAGSGGWDMEFALGNWLTVQKVLDELEISSDELEAYFTRLQVKDLYAENIMADNLDFYWLDPDGTIDIDKILGEGNTFTLDNILDGENNVSYKAMHLDASGVTLEENTLYTLRLSGEAAAKVWKGTTAQTDPVEGDLWLDTNYTPNRVMRYTDGAWEELPADDVADLEKGIYIRELKSVALTADGLVIMDEIDTSGTFGKIQKAALSAAGLVLLDEAVEGTYGLVLSTDISAGHILLSECSGDLDDIANGVYGKVKSTDISAGHIILSTCSGDLDDVDNGSTYGKLRLTDLDSGHIKLTSNVVVDGEWYDESGVEIDASTGINIYGTNQAFTTRATKTGTVQCYVGSDGKIYAGAGAVYLDADGITIKGQTLYIRTSAGVLEGYLYGTSYGLAVNAGSGKNISIGINATYIGSGIGLSGTLFSMAGCEYADLPQRSSAPTGTAGRMYFNTTDGRWKYYRDGAWKQVVDESG